MNIIMTMNYLIFVAKRRNRHAIDQISKHKFHTCFFVINTLFDDFENFYNMKNNGPRTEFRPVMPSRVISSDKLSSFVSG